MEPEENKTPVRKKSFLAETAWSFFNYSWVLGSCDATYSRLVADSGRSWYARRQYYFLGKD